MSREPSPTPWFCPSCRMTSDEAPRSALCVRCGSTMVRKGYCPVCEGFQPREAGELCPKHDLPLEVGAPDPSVAEELGPWVEVARFSDAQACQAPRIRLEAEGIPTAVEGERMGDRAMYHVAVGGVKLNVPASLEADARVILSQSWSRDAAELGIEDEDWDDFDEFGPRDKDKDESPASSSPLGTLRSLVHPMLALEALIWVVILGAGLLAFLGRSLGW